jgi:chemotaxis protein CheD
MSTASANGEPREEGLTNIYLLPGRMHCSPEPVIVTTVLGSCVSVCLHDRVSGFSGINHFVLPTSDGADTGLRYGDYAIDRLIGALVRLCGPKAKLEAKVFGGSEMFATRHPMLSVGPRNVDIALAKLAEYGIPVVARVTGRRSGLHLRYLTATGVVMLRRVNRIG